MGKTSIEWATDVWNPISGCSKVSPGCEACYAIRETNRHRNLPKFSGLVQDMEWTGEVRCHPDLLDQPYHWKKPRRIFVASMSDLFHSKVPWDFVMDVFETIRQCRQHTFLLLTKRPGRMAYFAEKVWPYWSGMPWPENCWAGTSVESQTYAPRLDCLLRVPAKFRFVSAEPLLGPLDLRRWLGGVGVACPHDLGICHHGCTAACWRRTNCAPLGSPPERISWVIAGGESGSGARPSHPDWFRNLRDQCQRAGVPFFFKQWGEWVSTHDVSLAVASNPKCVFRRLDGATVYRVGKKAAGALLDGREWRDMPT